MKEDGFNGVHDIVCFQIFYVWKQFPSTTNFKAWINQHPQTHQFSSPHSSYGLWMKSHSTFPFFPFNFFGGFFFSTFPPFFFSSPHFFLLLSSFFHFFFSSSFFSLLHLTYPTHQHPLVFMHHCHPPIPHTCSFATRMPSPLTFTYNQYYNPRVLLCMCYVLKKTFVEGFSSSPTMALDILLLPLLRSLRSSKLLVFFCFCFLTIYRMRFKLPNDGNKHYKKTWFLIRSNLTKMFTLIGVVVHLN